MRSSSFFSKDRKRLSFYLLLSLTFLLTSLFVFTPLAAAKTVKVITLPWDNPAKKPVPPSFVLPKQNRWGCLACHGNKNLAKFRNGKEVSLFIDEKIIGNSMHKKIACLDCHTNFSYETHPASTPKDFRKVAGLACMKCHPYQAYQYRNSVHGLLALQNKYGKIAGKKTKPAICSSCHGFHDIQSPRFEPFRSKFRAAAGKVCGKCHFDRWASFADYYHGRGFKAGAKDAPTCWDCHNNHRVLRKTDVNSTVYQENLPQTCGQCHNKPTSVLTSYAPLIHNRSQAFEANPIIKIVRLFIPKRPVAKEKPEVKPAVTLKPQPEGLLTRIWRFFFPPSLRPLKTD